MIKRPLIGVGLIGLLLVIMSMFAAAPPYRAYAVSSQLTPTPIDCEHEWWQQTSRALSAEQYQQIQQAFEALGFGGSFQTVLQGEIDNCGTLYLPNHFLQVVLAAQTPRFDHVRMQRQADALYAMHSELRAAPYIVITLVWGELPNRCIWRMSSNRWSNDDPSSCPSPRESVVGTFNYLPWATR